jgi:hypothetical protein
MGEAYQEAEELHWVVEVVDLGLVIWRRELKWLCVEVMLLLERGGWTCLLPLRGICVYVSSYGHGRRSGHSVDYRPDGVSSLFSPW